MKELRPEEIVELIQKVSDDTVTVGQMIEAATFVDTEWDTATTLSNTLQKSGISLDMPFKDLSTPRMVKELLDNKATSSATFIQLYAMEHGAKSFYILNQDIIDNPKAYPYTAENSKRITGEGGIARDNRLLGRKGKSPHPKSVQVRGSRKFDAIPKLDITIKKIIQGTKAIPDPQTRSAVAFNAFVFFRPNEVHELTLDDVDLETGVIKEKKSNPDDKGGFKKVRPKIILPKDSFALEILRDAAELAKKEGRKEIFDTNTSKMTKALQVPGGIKELFLPNTPTLGREIVGVSDLRKLIPSAVAQELGADAFQIASIMGHQNSGNISSDIARVAGRHYISPMEGVDEVSTKVLQITQNMIAHAGGISTVNEFATAFNVSASNLWDDAAGSVGKSGVLVVPTIDSGRLEPIKKQKLSPSEKKAIEAQQKANTEASLERAAISEKVREQSLLEAQELRFLRYTKKGQIAEARVLSDIQEKLAKAKVFEELAPNERALLLKYYGNIVPDTAEHVSLFERLKIVVGEDFNWSGAEATDDDLVKNAAKRRVLRRSANAAVEEALEEAGEDKDKATKLISKVLTDFGISPDSKLGAKLLGRALVTGALFALPIPGARAAAGAVALETGVELAVQSLFDHGTIGGKTPGDLEDLSQKELLQKMQSAREAEGGTPFGYGRYGETYGPEDVRGGQPIEGISPAPGARKKGFLTSDVPGPRGGIPGASHQEELEKEAMNRYFKDVEASERVMAGTYREQGGFVKTPPTEMDIRKAYEEGFVPTKRTSFMDEYDDYFKHITPF